MTEFLPWLLGFLVVVVGGGVVWYTFGRQVRPVRKDGYLHALERWLDGDLEQARQMLHDIVHDDPQSIDPYLQLGNLLRIQGDPGRAAMLHRSLTVRPDLPHGKRLTVGLALAEDLIALKRWDEALGVLEGLLRGGTDQSRFWRARFAALYGKGDLPAAARALKRARNQVPEKDRAPFEASYAAFQLDRARQHVLRGELADARNRLRDVEKIPGARVRSRLVKALAAAAEGDSGEAVTVATEDLLDSPRELALLLPMLQDLLLQQGQYARTIPLLERACQSETAPASLWIALAMLYEKIGEREKAIRLLESKARRRGLTPDAASPFLRLLVAEARHTDFARVWEQLSLPRQQHVWACRSCGRRDRHIRWFCPECLAFDSYHEESVAELENAVAEQ